jgi:hypothetical protein
MNLGVFVGEDMWTFFREIYADLEAHYRTEVFTRTTYNPPIFNRRINRWAFHNSIRSMLRRNDVSFFEWASDLLVAASHMPKECVIVTRLHSFELYEWAPKINWDAVDKVILVSRSIQEMFIDQYPESQQIMKESPEYQQRFK